MKSTKVGLSTVFAFLDDYEFLEWDLFISSFAWSSQQHWHIPDSSQGFFLLTSGSSSWTTGPESPSTTSPVKWCALSHHERLKCDEWSVNSGGQIECESAETTEDCIDKIVVCLFCLSRAVSPTLACWPTVRPSQKVQLEYCGNPLSRILAFMVWV